MDVVLEAIKFNHDPNSATSDALNLRRNAAQFVPVPEWRRGLSINPEDSPAAYAIKETRGHTLTIQVQLRRTTPGLQTVQVRAIDPIVKLPPGSGCLAALLWIVYAILVALFGNVLGVVKAKQVTFLPNGYTDFETFALQYVHLWRVGVGVHTTTWQWQYRHHPGDPWKNFDRSTHRIYTVLEVPKTPWQQTPYTSANTQLPWLDVLDYACRWALLAHSLDRAAGLVTRSVYDLGPTVVEYDCPGGGSTHYALIAFNCTAFLERLRGGIGNGPYVNCTDCATFVSTFANILGCDLWQSRMGYGFELNPILAIGSSVWQTACNWGSFSYHEVAWESACTENDDVFDGCLQVDGDPDPTTAPHTPLLPTDLRFGNPGDGQYRDRLCTPAGRPSCAPQPTTRQRRAIV